MSRSPHAANVITKRPAILKSATNSPQSIRQPITFVFTATPPTLESLIRRPVIIRVWRDHQLSAGTSGEVFSFQERSGQSAAQRVARCRSYVFLHSPGLVSDTRGANYK